MGVENVRDAQFFVFPDLGLAKLGSDRLRQATHNNPIGADDREISVMVQKLFAAAQSERFRPLSLSISAVLRSYLLVFSAKPP